MAPDDEEDLYNDEFDFVDDEDDEGDEDDRGGSEVETDEADSEVDRKPARREETTEREREPYDEVADEVGDEEPVDRPEPVASHLVHIYEFRQFMRTIDRPFTAEDAESFASEYNRTAKPYGRFAVAGKNDAKPRKSLD